MIFYDIYYDCVNNFFLMDLSALKNNSNNILRHISSSTYTFLKK